MVLGGSRAIGGITHLLVEPALNWLIGKVEPQQTREKTTEERDWVLSELFEDWRQFIYEHTDPYAP